MRAFQTINRICRDCGQEFIITPQEQERFAELSFDLPKRCLQCRKKRKAGNNNQSSQEVKSDSSPQKSPEEIENELFEQISVSGYHSVKLQDIKILASEKTLIVIGNGFDIIHGVRSSYREFDRTIGKNSELRLVMEAYLQCGDLWSNLEESLGTLSAGKMLDTMDIQLDCFGAYDSDSQAADYYMAIDEAMSPIYVLINNLPKRFRQWIEGLTVDRSTADSVRNKFLKLILPRAHYLNFNYTEFLETEYGVAHEQIKYIHGCRKRVKGQPKEELVLGHKPDVDYFKDYKPSKAMIPHYKSKYKAYILESAMENAVSQWVEQYEETFTKKTSEIIRKNKEFFANCDSIEDVVVIGHSLSIVDYPYFYEIVKNNEGKAKWHIGYHSLDDFKRLRNLTNYLGLRADEIEVFRT